MAIHIIRKDMDSLILSLASLARDMERLRAAGAPSETDLAKAPVLHAWEPAFLAAPCLVGAVSNHPLLGDKHIHTSDLVAIDTTAGWARTWSRYYRLGIPASKIAEEVGRA